MLKNFLRASVRNLLKNKSHSFLNIAGLAIGVACAGLIFLWVENEMSYDTSYAKKDRLYWIRETQTYEGVLRTFLGTPGPLSPALKKEMPGIVNSCRSNWPNKALFSLADKSVYETGLYADSSIFDMFGFTFVEGNLQTAFKDLYSVVVTEKMAGQFFGSSKNAIGKSLMAD